MGNAQLFQMVDGNSGFEEMGKENGHRFWLATQLAEALGYDSYAAFKQAINKAMAACGTLNIPIHENFTSFEDNINGRKETNFKLSRFACYLTAMNADVRKEPVAAAQAYFAGLAVAFRQWVEESENVERLVIRGEISEHEKSLNSAAKQALVENYPFFQNAGYLGMYNMNLSRLREMRGIPGDRSPLDFMGKTELAANLFRITMTEEKIKNERISGQRRLEQTANEVGKKVRKTVIELSGVSPEQLPCAEDIQDVKRDLKQTHKKFKQIDAPKKTAKKKSSKPQQ